MTYVLDSNIISFLLRGDEKVRDIVFGLLKDSHEMRIPLVAYYEVKRGLLKKDADIFIAATSIEHGFTLLTNNTEHMKRVKDLRFVRIEK